MHFGTNMCLVTHSSDFVKRTILCVWMFCLIYLLRWKQMCNEIKLKCSVWSKRRGMPTPNQISFIHSTFITFLFSSFGTLVDVAVVDFFLSHPLECSLIVWKLKRAHFTFYEVTNCKIVCNEQKNAHGMRFCCKFICVLKHFYRVSLQFGNEWRKI